MAKKSRTREARQRRQKQRRQSRRLLIVAAIVVVAVVGIAVFIVSNQPVDAFIPEELSARYEGIERSNSTDGYPRLGDPGAPVTVEEYASFACPGCEAFHSDSFDAVLERVQEGQVLFTYVPLNTGAIPNAAGASRAALCAGKQGMFWEMHDVLFEWQTRYANTAFSQNRLLTGVEELGLSSSGFTSCFNSFDVSSTLEAAAAEDVSTTPTLKVNGVTIEAEQAGTIPSSATILQAIDDVTPDDWWQMDETAQEQGDEREEVAEAAETPVDDAEEATSEEQEAVSEDQLVEESDESVETEPIDDETDSDVDESQPAEADDSDAGAEQENVQEDTDEPTGNTDA